jgi:hypothetical protein
MHRYVVEIINIWQPQTSHKLLQPKKCASQQPYTDNTYISSIYSFMIYLMPLSVLQTIPHKMARLLNNYQNMVGAKPIQTYYNQQRFYPKKFQCKLSLTQGTSLIFIHKLSTLPVFRSLQDIYITTLNSVSYDLKRTVQ